MKRKRILSGMQPSGKLHLGNYHGALKNWLVLQEDYDCFYFIADWHSLTTLYEKPHLIRQFSFEVAVDWLASGLDPEKCTLFVQSDISEHAELHLLLSMIVPVPWLERNPTYKEKQVEVKRGGHELLRVSGLSRAADRGHRALQSGSSCRWASIRRRIWKLSREIVRRFHDLYKKKVFIEPAGENIRHPQAQRGRRPQDEQKLQQHHQSVATRKRTDKARKVQSMLTDPQAGKRREDPGEPGRLQPVSVSQAVLAESKCRRRSSPPAGTRLDRLRRLQTEARRFHACRHAADDGKAPGRSPPSPRTCKEILRRGQQKSRTRGQPHRWGKREACHETVK